MTDIVCIGEPMLEFNQRPDGLYENGFGGDISNAAVSAARQDARVSFLTRVGKDTFGDEFIRLWESEDIATQHVIRDPDHPTAIYFVTHDEQGHHFSYRRAGSAASAMRPGDFPAESISAAKVLHVSAITMAISASAADTVFDAINSAREAGTRVSFDTNLRLNLWPITRARALVHEAMRQCQIALPSYDDAVELCQLEDPDAIVDFYLSLGAEIVALKIGAKGSLIATPDERQTIPGLVVDSIDANAAGDTFAGAFLAELVAGRNPFQAAGYANAAAALSTTNKGAVTSIPRRAQVEALLQQQH